MSDSDKERRELIRELGVRFQSSSDVMRLIAKRIGEAADIHQHNHHRLERVEETLGKSVDPHGSAIPFSYREFIEFTSAEEFARFRHQDPIKAEDIANIDWDTLARGLLGGN
ncbi:MAG: hypothetical protein LBU79_00260 [Planctomycetota bacterium]|jgi:hypothetical protein|nr:hypothetical protein [Planctomycetota bacterium]